MAWADHSNAPILNEGLMQVIDMSEPRARVFAEDEIKVLQQLRERAGPKAIHSLPNLIGSTDFSRAYHGDLADVSKQYKAIFTSPVVFIKKRKFSQNLPCFNG